MVKFPPGDSSDQGGIYTQGGKRILTTEDEQFIRAAGGEEDAGTSPSQGELSPVGLGYQEPVIFIFLEFFKWGQSDTKLPLILSSQSIAELLFLFLLYSRRLAGG